MPTVGPRYVKVGRLRVPVLYTSLQEAVGDTLEAVGGSVVAGERRPRPFNLELPIHGLSDGTDADVKLAGERLRRQARSLMDNTSRKLEALYFHTAEDHELIGWIVVGGGQIEQVGQTSLVRADWKLVLSDCYKIASPTTHMDARRIEAIDRRLPTTPRDARGQVYSSDFMGEGPTLPVAYLPPGYRMATGMMGLLTVVTLATMEGDVGIVEGVTDGEVLMYEQREGMRHHADVLLHDRRGIPTIAPTFRQNLHTNPGVEDNLTGWTTGGTNTLARAFGPGIASRSGHWGLKAIYSNSTTLAAWTGVTLTAAQHTFSVWVKIPRDWTGGEIRVDAVNFTGATGEVAANADMNIRDTWQRLNVRLTVVGGDLTGDFQVITAAVPPAGQFIHVDDAQIETGATPTAYFDGDSRFCRWTGAIHASTSQSYGDPEDFGWEEILGENWPLYDHSDPPVVSNSLCRVRREPAVTSAAGFAIDSFVVGTGWVETARFHMGASAFPFTEVMGGHVVEWSPERAVVAVSLNSATTMIGTLYITLQRGWQGPRLELYADGPDGLLPGDLYIDVAPNDTNHMAIVTGEKKATNPVALTVTDTPGATQGLVWNPTGTEEPWVMLTPIAGSGRAFVAALNLANVNVYWTDDTFGYGSTRRGLSFVNESDIVPMGYIGVQLTQTARMPVLQAEDGTNGTGSSDVADANARGGNAVENTNTGDPALASLTFSPSQLFDDTTVGNVVGVWARVLVVTGGATGQIQMNYGSDASNGPVSFTSTTYVWVRVDETARVSGEDLDFELWRSAGSGNVRIDSVIVIPLEQRQVGGAFNGPVDFSDRSLQDVRQIPDLVSR